MCGESRCSDVLFGVILPQGPVVPGEEGEEIPAEEEEEVIHKYEPPVPKEWVSMGSEEAVADESLKQNRTLVSTLPHHDIKVPYPIMTKVPYPIMT